MLASEVIREVRPVDQMRSTYGRQIDDLSIVEKVHRRFQQRMAFQNFNPQVLDRLTNQLEQALAEHPHNAQLKYELAWALAQNCADQHTLERALKLTSEVLAGSCYYPLSVDHSLPAALISKAKRLHRLLTKTTSDVWLSAEPRVPRRINWAVYNRCPMVCMGCYNCFSPTTLTIDEAKVGLHKLAEAGVQSLIVSGGDPILWSDLPEFLAFAWEIGLSVGIDTTGYTITKDLLQQIGPYLQYVGLPLDGSSRDIQNKFRRGPKDILDHTLRNLELCDELGISVKINTTVNNYNINDLINIGRIVAAHDCVHNWSVFQWSPLRSTSKLHEEFSVDPDIYEERAAEVHESFPDLNVRTRSTGDRELTHFFIQSNGQVVTFGSAMNEEFILGNILTDDINEMVSRPMFNKCSSKHIPTDRFVGGAINRAIDRDYAAIESRRSSLHVLSSYLN